MRTSPLVARTLLAAALALAAAALDPLGAAGAPPAAAAPTGLRFTRDVLTVFGGNRSVSAGQLNQMLQKLGAAQRLEESQSELLALHYNRVGTLSAPFRTLGAEHWQSAALRHLPGGEGWV